MKLHFSPGARSLPPHMALRPATACWVAAAMITLSALAAPELRAAQGDRPVAAATLRAGSPPAGHYDGQLCVGVGGAAEQCGPVALQFQSGKARVQVSDLVYHLHWRVPTSKMVLVLMHGGVQVDEFVTEGLWSTQSLRFKDVDKDVRYELRWSAMNRR